MTLNCKLVNPIRLRRLRVCCTLILALTMGMASAHAAEPPRQLFPAPVYVTLQSSDAVETLPSGHTWTGFPGAHYIAVTPNGNRLLVSSTNLPVAWLVDAHSGKKLATFKVGPIAQGVEIGPKGRYGLAVSAKNGTVAVINIPEQKLVKFIHVGKVPHNVRFTSNGKLAYVTLQGDGGVAVVDMQTLKKVGEFPVPGLKMPHNLDLSVNGKVLWIRGFLGKVAAVNLKTHRVLAVIPVGPSHAGIDVIPGGRYVFTGAIAGHDVDVIDPKTFKVVKRIDVGQGPHGVRASRNGRFAYVGVTGINKMAVIDTRTLAVVKQISTHGKVPFWVAVVGND